MKMNRKRLFAWVVLTPVVALSGIVYAFPYFSTAKLVGKPSPAKQRAAQSAEQRRIKQFVEPLSEAMNQNRSAEVKRLWSGYQAAGYREDSWLRLQVARHLVAAGDNVAAEAHLHKLLNPLPGVSSTLQSSGEVMSLWLQVAGPLAKTRNSELGKWKQRRNGSRGTRQLSTPSEVEGYAHYRAGQELMALGRNAEAMRHYEKAVFISPNSAFLWRQLGLARERAGDLKGSKRAIIRSYELAEPEDRADLRRRFRLTQRDIASSVP